MSKQKLPPPKPKTTTPARPASVSDGLSGYRFFLWSVFFVGSLFVLPGCLDLSLAPRFLFVSAAMVVSIALIWSDLREHADFRLNGFDLLFLVWYGWNLASVSWAFNWSEAVFFTQKVWLGFAAYWLFRQALHRDEAMVRRTLARIVPALSFAVTAILLVQLGQAIGSVGLDNESLYDFAKGVYGNKGLATDFLFFLLIFNLLLYRDFSKKWLFWLASALLLALILVLQTRTVYIAVVVGAVWYFPVRAWVEADFRPIFLKKLLPLGLLGAVALGGLLAVKGQGSSLTERLNPMTYLESASAKERRFVWWKTDELNKKHPVHGVGNGSWKIWFPSEGIQGAYRLQEKGVIFTRAHNDYLEIRSELGMVGAVLFIAFFGAAALTILLGLKKNESPAHSHDLAVLGAGLLGFCVIQYFDFPRERIEMQVVMGFFFAWVAFLSRDFWAKMPGLQLGKAGVALPVLLAAGLFFNVVIGWFRYEGERHMFDAMEAHANSNWRKVLQAVPKAENRFYQFNDVALPVAWYEGVAYFQANDIARSVAAFERAYALNPWSFQIINNYASALVKKGKLREAIELYEKTLVINPRYDEGKLNLSYTYYQLGDYQKSREYALAVDTIVGARTPDEIKKNKATWEKRALFLREIEKKEATATTGGGN